MAAEHAALVHVTTEPQLPYLPERSFDRARIAMFTGLEIDSVPTKLEIITFSPPTSPREDGDDFAKTIRKRTHTIYCRHSECGISLVISLAVNETDLEVMNLDVSRDSIQPLWARGAITKLMKQMPEGDVSLLLYGVSDLARTAIIRAKTFAKLATEFEPICAVKSSSASSSSAGSSSDIEDSSNKKARQAKRLKYEQKRNQNTKRWLGDSKVEFVSPSSGIKFVLTWELSIDPSTGEGRSTVDAFASTPSYCM